MDIIVAHEGKQHSFRTATALYQKGYLFKYITTIYDKPFSLTRIIKTLLNGKLGKKCASHRTDALPDEMILQYCEWKGLLRLFLSKIPFLYDFFPRYYDWLHNSFGRKVAEYAIKNDVDAVIMYDTNANEYWRILKEKAPNIIRIMDVSIANRVFMKENYIADMKRTNSEYLKLEQKHIWNEKKIKLNLEEIKDTQYFLIASNMVKRSMMFSGVKEEQMFMAPYGVDCRKFDFIQKKTLKLPLKLVYVGQVTYRKGIHHLLKVINRFSDKDVELYLAGGYSVETPFVQEYKNRKNIHFLGFVTRDILASLYQKCDVFVFPTLGEGYGMVILEALSCGVPCIVSDLAGGDDAIIEGINGFKFKAGDDDELFDKISWFMHNPDKLPEMSINSRKSVEKQTWQSYYDCVIKAVENILNKD